MSLLDVVYLEAGQCHWKELFKWASVYRFKRLEVDAAIGSRNAKPWLVIALFVIKIDFIDALKV